MAAKKVEAKELREMQDHIKQADNIAQMTNMIEARAHHFANVSVVAHLKTQMKMILKEFDCHHKSARERIVSKLQKKRWTRRWKRWSS